MLLFINIDYHFSDGLHVLEAKVPLTAAHSFLDCQYYAAIKICTRIILPPELPFTVMGMSSVVHILLFCSFFLEDQRMSGSSYK